MKVGVCGIGRMGAAIAERLIETGHDVRTWNRTAASCEPLKAMGAKVADSPADLAETTDLVLVIVANDAAQSAVYGAPNGLASVNLDGRLIIDMSTVSQESSRAAAERIAAASGTFLECPVGGTVTPAKTGKLLGLAGGDIDAFERAKPLLENLCRRIEHVGPVGSGAAAKLAINLPLAVYWEALGEALAIAVAGGISKELAIDLLGDSTGAIPVAKMRIPAILDAIDGEEAAPPAFDIASMTKDLGLMVATAEKFGVTAPVAASAHDAYKQAREDGWADRDASTQAAWRVRSTS
ncbi:MAG: NAD(P)-dependent oxidoreductase [Hyphomicrobiaceae bacterium]